MELTISCKTGCLYKRTQLQLSFELLSFGGIYRHFSDKSASLFLVSQSCRDKPTLSRLFFSVNEIGALRLEGDVRNHVQILLTAIFVCLTDNIIREDYRPVISTSLHEMSDVLIDHIPNIVVGFQSVLVADVENAGWIIPLIRAQFVLAIFSGSAWTRTISGIRFMYSS